MAGTRPIRAVCDAHGMMYDEIGRLREDQGQIYDLIRDLTSQVAVINTAVATLKVSTDDGFRTIEKSQEDADRKLSDSFIRMEALLTKAPPPSVQHPAPRRRWSSKSVVALVSTVLGSGGIGVIILAIINSKK